MTGLEDWNNYENQQDSHPSQQRDSSIWMTTCRGWESRSTKRGSSDLKLLN